MTLLKTVLIFGAVAVSVPVIAAQMDMPDPTQPQKRADVVARAKAHFAQIDANRDSFVTLEEIATMREAHRKDMRDARFKAMDTNNDGSLSPTEFGEPAKGMRKRGDDAKGPPPLMMGAPGQGMGAMMLTRADTNKDGKLSEAEYSDAILTMFDRADANHDGTVTADERRAARDMMMDRMRQGRGRR